MFMYERMHTVLCIKCSYASNEVDNILVENKCFMVWRPMFKFIVIITVVKYFTNIFLIRIH